MDFIQTFFIWWKNGLLMWLPLSIQTKLQQKPYIQCSLNEQYLLLSLIDSAGQTQDTLSIDLSVDKETGTNEPADSSIQKATDWLAKRKNLDCLFLINEGQRLIKTIKMPGGARNNLKEMIRFEIDRQTPFNYDQVYVGYKIKNDDKSKGQSFTLTLAITPKKVLLTIKESLKALHLEVDSLITHDSDGIIKTPLSETSKALDTRTLSIIFFTGLMLALGFYLLYQPINFYEKSSSEMQSSMAFSKKQTEAYLALKTKKTELTGYSYFLDEKLTGYQKRINILKYLTTILPQHTWLNNIDIQDSELVLSGESSTASDLVALLTSSGLFSNVQFNAPTRKNPTSGKDQFKIRATLNASSKHHES